MIYPDRFEHKIGFTAVRQRVAELCGCDASRAMVEAMAFSASASEVRDMLEPADEMLRLLRAGEMPPLDGLGNPADVLRAMRLPGTFAPASELLSLRRALAVVADTADFFAVRRDEEGRSPLPALDAIACRIGSVRNEAAAIDRVMDRYGEILDNASPELAAIRRQLSAMSGSVNSAMRRVMARAVAEGVLEADAAPAMRDGRLVIPVAPMNKRRISGIVHDESASGKTVFIEPAEVVEANNRIRELQMEERREITRILIRLADELRPSIPSIEESVGVVASLDFVRAKARYAVETDACMPSLSDGPELEWYHACHPELLLSLRRQGREIVPLDIVLTPAARLLVISGPNAGGKSVCLKTVGVLQYMLQCGLLPPVHDNSHFGIFSDIFVDIGDDQSIEDDLSTYSSHLRNMKTIVGSGRRGSLVLIDEFGGGTEPQIGGAIAQAILHRFADLGLWGVVTTHYQNLKHFAEDTDGLVNGSMLYDRHLMQPLFRLSIGNPGSSFAVEIARKTGLPQEIIREAEEIVGSDYVNLDKYLLDIARDRKYWENKRMAIRQKEKKLEETLRRYEEEAETLRSQRREIIGEARQEAKKILEGSNAAIERTIRTIREAQADRERTQQARRRLEQQRRQMEEAKGVGSGANELLRRAPKARKPAPAQPQADKERRPIAVGDAVKLDGEGAAGRVLEVSGKRATVAFGMLKTTVDTARLRHTAADPDRAPARSASFVSASTADNLRDRQLSFKRDIDVRGMRVDEALQAITYFIDDAVQFSAGRVRILHGTGTGALRQAIRQYLDTVAGVASYRDEHVQFGGAGITVVDLS